MGQLGRRQAVLFSLIVHLMIVTALTNRLSTEVPVPKPQVSPTPRPRLVFVPPRAAVRPAPAVPVAPVPAPRPAEPPRPNAKDRISIGGPSAEQAKRLLLERDRDITKEAPAPPAPATVPSASPGPIGPGAGVPDPRNAQLREPGAPRRPGLGTEDSRPLSSSLKRVEERLGNIGGGGMGGGPGRQMGPLFFDPQGADFTAWINHFKNEVYRNWIPPQAVLFGFAGHCDFEFSVERDGRLTGLRMVKSTGTPALDRAAQNALLGSRLMALPNDFAPPRVTMQVTFFYNENPQGS